MKVTAKVRAWSRGTWRQLTGTGQWPLHRIVGEAMLSLLLGLLAVGVEQLQHSSDLRTWTVALGVMVVSPLRRALPGTVLLLSSAVSVVVGGMWGVLIVAGWSAGRRIHGVGRALAVFGVSLVLGAVLPLLWDLPKVSPGLAVSMVALFVAVVVMPGIAGRYWAQRRTLLETLHAQRTQLLRENAMIARQTQLRERQRIAQDMHDSLGHQLTLISVHTGALEVDPQLSGRQREAVGVLRDASVAAMRELREVVGLLHDEREQSVPAQGEPGAGQRGVALVDGLIESSRGVGTRIQLVRSGEPRPLPPAADRAAYRIVQEGLTNAHKHATGAPVTVALRYEPDSLLVEVVNGPVPAGVLAGGPAISGGQGLTGLRERARLVGGMVHSGRTVDGGFRLAGVLPYGPAGSWGAASAADGADDLASSSPTRVEVRSGAGDGAGAGGEVRAGGAAGAPVMDWSPRSLLEAPARPGTGQEKRGGFGMGCGLAVGVVLGLGLLAAWGFVALLGAARQSSVSPQLYESVRIGQPEHEVRARLPKGSFMNEDMNEKGPKLPAGADCETFSSTEPEVGWETETAYRFCFRDGRLVEKKTFEAKI